MKTGTMNICMIGCWFRDDIYSHHFYNLLETIKKEGDMNVKLVTSNCNCFSSAQNYSIAKDELLNNNCDVIKIPYAPDEPSKNYGMLKYYFVKIFQLNFFLEIARGISFFLKTRGCRIIHFDQVLRAFGFLSFFTLLNLAKMFNKKVVITIHELDPLQEKHKKLNEYYNKADKITVFSQGFKEELINRGVRENKIEVVHFGQSLMPIKNLKRDQFIFFGGHKLLKGKGFDTLLNALKILRTKGKKIKLLIYTGWGCIGLEDGKKRVDDMRLNEYIIWSDFLYGHSLAKAYQRSIGCIIPFTAGSGRYPATSAMANATPVIATRKAGLPEYLGELGRYIEENSAKELADAIIHLVDNPDVVKALGSKLRKRAQERFSDEVIGKNILEVYKKLSLEPT